jgi:hypothetical protein
MSISGPAGQAPTRASKTWMRTILDLDRRIIYAIVFFLVLIPLIKPLKLPVEQTESVEKAWQMVEDLNAGEALLISVDFGPSTAPECLPVYVSLLHQCFRKGIHPIIVSLVPDGRGMAIRGLNMVRDARNAGGELLYPNIVDGQDYAFLGYKAGTLGPIIGMGQSFAATFPRDGSNRPIGELPLMGRIRKMGDCGALFTVAAVATPDYYLPYGSERYHVPMAVSCTAVSAAQYSPYYIAGQFKGLVNGMKGAAEYEQFVGLEQIIGAPGDATKGMDAQTMVHVFIVLAILLANLALYFERKAGPQRRSA